MTILTLNDKRLNTLKHNKGILVKDVNSGKFDVMEIGNYPSNIIEIAIVKITEPGLSRTISLWNIRQIVKNLNAKEVYDICKAGKYEIINHPDVNRPLIKKEIKAEPKEYYQGPLKEEEISEEKFGVKFLQFDYKLGNTEYTCFYKGTSLEAIKNEFRRDNPNATNVKIRSDKHFVVSAKHNSYSSKSDKKISLNKANELQTAIREFNYITGRNVILSVSAANSKFAIVEDGKEVYSTNKANKLHKKIFALLAIWKIRNQEIAKAKIQERKEKIQKLVANGFGE